MTQLYLSLLSKLFFFARCLVADNTVEKSYRSFPLSQINSDFHNRYEERIFQTIATFGVQRPVILVLNGTMMFCWHDQYEKVEILSVEYHTIKAFAHSSLAVLLSFLHDESKPISHTIIGQLNAQRQHIVDALIELSHSGPWTEEMMFVANGLGNATIVFLDRMIENHYNWSFTQLRMLYHTTVQTWIDRAFKLAAKVMLFL